MTVLQLEQILHNFGGPKNCQFLSPPVQVAQWAHMHRFLSVCLSVCTGPQIGENNSYLQKYSS